MQLKNAWALALEKDKWFLSRKRQFSIGFWLALWPVVVAALVPSQLFAGFDVNLLFSNRFPVIVFCVAALVSEAVAVLLFVLVCRRFVDRSEDRLTFWSVIAAAAAAVGTLAFLIAAVANVMQIG
ncbi:MAG: hypothetical protein WBQ34_17070 [Candidatus Acidiferrales bacterium]